MDTEFSMEHGYGYEWGHGLEHRHGHGHGQGFGLVTTGTEAYETTSACTVCIVCRYVGMEVMEWVATQKTSLSGISFPFCLVE